MRVREELKEELSISWGEEKRVENDRAMKKVGPGEKFGKLS